MLSFWEYQIGTAYVLTDNETKKNDCGTDREFVQNFTPPDFQGKNFTPSISPNFNSFSTKKTQQLSENGEIYTTGKNFTLPPGLTGWTNSTSGMGQKMNE